MKRKKPSGYLLHDAANIAAIITMIATITMMIIMIIKMS